ncbi:MAG TPA: hypothetical protein VK116_15360 [Planctomycetota bacterium]|nr:hypothetical protein [Planctomycetota bacterium]
MGRCDRRQLQGLGYGRVDAVRHQVFKLPSGLCTCVIGDPIAGSRRIDVLKISGTEAVLDPNAGLETDQFIYSTVELEDGPSMALSGFVIAVGPKGTIVQWSHPSPKAADRIGKVLAEYARTQAERAAARSADEEDSTPANEPETQEIAATEPAVETAPQEVSAATEAKSDPPPATPRPQENTERSQEPRRRKIVVGDGVTLNTNVKKEGQAPRSEDKSARSDSSSPNASEKASASDSASKRARSSAGSRATRTQARDQGATTESPPPWSDPSNAASDDEKKPTVVRVGDRLDVAASIRNRAKAVRAAELASRVDTVHVLNLGTIKELIKAAVDEAVAMLGPTLGEIERRKLLDEAEEGFREQLKAFQAEKAGIAAQAQMLEEQLEKAKSLLEEERQRVVSSQQFTVSDQGMVEIETRFQRLLERAIHAGKVSGDLENDMRGVIGRLLDDEREKIRAQAEAAQNDKIALLEKKVARLASNLEATAKERDRARLHAQALEAAGGVVRGNIRLPGLAEDDPDRSRKLDLLKEIFQFNQEVRQEIARSRGVELPPAKTAVPPDSSAPSVSASAAGSAPDALSIGDEDTSTIDTDDVSQAFEDLVKSEGIDESSSAAADGTPADETRSEAHAAAEAALDVLLGERDNDDRGHESRGEAEGDELEHRSSSKAGGAGPDFETHEENAARASDDDSGEDQEERIPVLAEGGEEVDPDDLPWEPTQARSADDVRIRRLG